MSKLVFIIRLTIFATLLTVSLATFALVTQPQEEIWLGCATVDTPLCGNAIGGREPLDHPGYQIFQQNCKACHRLDIRLVGPALRYSFQTRDSVWFVKMIINPMKLIKSGDTAAVNLYNRYNQIQGTSFEDFTPQQITDLVGYLKLEGERELY